MDSGGNPPEVVGTKADHHFIFESDDSARDYSGRIQDKINAKRINPKYDLSIFGIAEDSRLQQRTHIAVLCIHVSPGPAGLLAERHWTSPGHALK